MIVRYDDARSAAWNVYVALHGLAASEVIAPLDTSTSADLAVTFLGDLDHAREQAMVNLPHLAHTHPDLAMRIKAELTAWDEAPPGRVVRLLGQLDELESITGGSLPLPMPPKVCPER